MLSICVFVCLFPLQPWTQLLTSSPPPLLTFFFIIITHLFSSFTLSSGASSPLFFFFNYIRSKMQSLLSWNNHRTNGPAVPLHISTLGLIPSRYPLSQLSVFSAFFFLYFFTPACVSWTFCSLSLCFSVSLCHEVPSIRVHPTPLRRMKNPVLTLALMQKWRWLFVKLDFMDLKKSLL